MKATIIHLAQKAKVMQRYTIKDTEGRIRYYEARQHSIEKGILSLSYNSTPFFLIKNWISVAIEVINELGEQVSNEVIENLEPHMGKYSIPSVPTHKTRF